MSQWRHALIIDMQNDFLIGGSVPAIGTEQIIPNILKNIKSCDDYLFVNDSHNVNNISFAQSHPGKSPGDEVSLCGMTFRLWEVHCLHSSKGALVVDELMPYFQGTRAVHAHIGFNKGCHWYDTGDSATPALSNMLSQRRWKETIVVMGVGLDHTIKKTVLSILSHFPNQFDVEVRLDCLASFDTKQGISSLEEMKRAGAILVA